MCLLVCLSVIKILSKSISPIFTEFGTDVQNESKCISFITVAVGMNMSSVCLSVHLSVRPSVMLCIVAKQYILW